LNSPPRTCSAIRDNPVSGAARMNELGVAHLSRFSLYLARARRYAIFHLKVALIIIVVAFVR